MIPFKGMKMCSRCEQPIMIGGFLMLPGKETIEHYCLGCALALAKEDCKERGVDVKKIQMIRPEENTNEDF